MRRRGFNCWTTTAPRARRCAALVTLFVGGKGRPRPAWMPQRATASLRTLTRLRARCCYPRRALAAVDSVTNSYTGCIATTNASLCGWLGASCKRRLAQHYESDETQTDCSVTHTPCGHLVSPACTTSVQLRFPNVANSQLGRGCCPESNWQTNFALQLHRRPGRPLTKWDDRLRSFAACNFPAVNTWTDIAETANWPPAASQYVQSFTNV